MQLDFESSTGNLKASAAAWWISEKHTQGELKIVLCKDQESANDTFQDLKFFAKDAASVLLLPIPDTLPYENNFQLAEISAQRINVLRNLASPKIKFLVTPVHSLLQKVLPPTLLAEQILNLKISDAFNHLQIQDWLSSHGYTRVKIAERPGDYRLLEKITDIVTPDQAGIRIETDSGRIISIRTFDVKSQRSQTKLTEIQLLPAREIFKISPDEIENLLPLLPNRLRSEYRDNFYTLPHSINLLASLKRHLPITEILPANSSFIFINASECWNSLLKFNALAEQRLTLSHEKNFEYKITELYSEIEIIRSELHNFNLHHLYEDIFADANYNNINLQDNLEMLPRFKNINLQNNEHPLSEICRELQKQKFKIIISAESEMRRDRINAILKSFSAEKATYLDYARAIESNSNICLIPKELSRGFKLLTDKVAIISDQEIFGRRQQRSKNKSGQEFSLKKILSALSLISEGDLIVHEQYGIGRYLGLKTMQISQISGEFIELQYADSKLILPVQKVTEIQKYSGPAETAPELDRLGSKKWPETKAKVYKSVCTLAGDLLKLYSRRSMSKANPLNGSDIAESEFADLFPYDETPDQLKAIQETLSDLASEKVCDRLICGDVGFGKTEVAMRAAFKAVISGRQVALLAPTTLLVDQHFENFKDRFSAFPVEVTAVSRFYSPRHNRTVLERVRDGKADLVIGTHRLLQNDVGFKDLGLLIIDEEHRFGVKQKERIKMLKKNLPVLTLSATPIPRTLYSSLIKIRDISLISTAPQDRLSVKTIVSNDSDEIIREAVLKELSRQGQIFYLYNQVASMPSELQRLRKILPEVKIACAHGQMKESELEELMHNFRDRKYDLLITTTIIESGIDLPNVNTLIIHRADKLGLAQLYQLRGRVGRGSRQAYAIFLVPEVKKLSSEARDRLSAIQSIDELGQGFQLAMRDLEIRGAGNLLGKEQSGNLFVVGYELYMKLLNRAILNLQNQNDQESPDPELKLNYPAFIPEDYIPETAERLLLYQRLALCQSQDKLNLLSEEIADRFGNLPEMFQNYITIMSIRITCQDNGIKELEQRADSLIVRKNSTHISIKISESAMKSTEKLKILFNDNLKNLP